MPTSVICGVIARRRGTSTYVVVAIDRSAGCSAGLDCRDRDLRPALDLGCTVVKCRHTRCRDDLRLSFLFTGGDQALICAVPNTPVVKPMTVLAIFDIRSLFGCTPIRVCSAGFQVVFVEPGNVAPEPRLPRGPVTNAELDTDVAAEVACCNDDTSFDLNLRFRLIE